MGTIERNLAQVERDLRAASEDIAQQQETLRNLVRHGEDTREAVRSVEQRAGAVERRAEHKHATAGRRQHRPDGANSSCPPSGRPWASSRSTSDAFSSRTVPGSPGRLIRREPLGSSIERRLSVGKPASGMALTIAALAMRKSSPDWRCVGLMQSAVALPVSRACPARTLRFAHPPAAQRRDVGSAGWQPPWLRAAEQHGS